jgi:hypothetical protein
MKAIKLITAIVIAAVLSGCVVHPIGYRGGYYGHNHQNDGPYYRR